MDTASAKNEEGKKREFRIDMARTITYRDSPESPGNFHRHLTKCALLYMLVTSLVIQENKATAFSGQA